MALRLRTVPGSAVPIYRQIVEQVRAHISRGDLAPGEGLPSVRAVAEELVVNANTVAKAYGELVRAGDAVSEPGRGLFVAERRPQLAAPERRRRLKVAVERLLAEAVSVGATREEIDAMLDTCSRQAGLPGREGGGDAESA